MAKQKRNQAPAKPITSHQLFPAVVALWFGALFGLGSLAVRPSLLESLVRSSRIDLILPAAAPPLGVTARMLMALGLAALGAVIGIVIARRLARPKVEVRERKRSARSGDAASYQPRYAQAATTAERPNPVYGQAGENEAGPGMLAQRRRALTVEHVEEDFVPHDMAPLPGGAPQILDIGAMGIGSEPAEAALDLTAYSETQERPAAVQEFVPVANPVQLDWNQAPPVAAAPGVAAPMPQAPRQEFQQPAPETPAPYQAPAAAPVDHVQFEHAADNRQVFGQSAPQPPVDAQRQIFGQPVDGDRVDPEFVRAAGFKTSVFETEEPAPLFAPRAQDAEAAPAAPAPAPMPQAFEVPPAPPVPVFDVPAAYEPPSQATAPVDPAPAQTFAAPAPAETIAAETPQPAQVEQPAPAPMPSPAGLGMGDLASRLAQSMARRRAARSGQTIAEPITEPEIPAPVPAAFEPAPEAVPAAIPVAFAPAAEVAPAEAPVPQAFEPAPAPMPVAAEPAQPPFAPFAAPTAPEPAPVAVAAPAIPQAMRPLDLDGFEEDDIALDSLLLPRHIPAAFAPLAPVAEPVLQEVPEAPAPEPVEEAEAADQGVAEHSYASLTDIAAPRGGFVRIDEPHNEGAAVEPVVIFPGQAARPIAAEESASFRRFDGPGAAGQGQPVATALGGSEVDPAEAERALRSALANLQRMSGAA